MYSMIYSPIIIPEGGYKILTSLSPHGPCPYDDKPVSEIQDPSAFAGCRIVSCSGRDGVIIRGLWRRLSDHRRVNDRPLLDEYHRQWKATQETILRC
jgi:hypothetical protein